MASGNNHHSQPRRLGMVIIAFLIVGVCAANAAEEKKSEVKLPVVSGQFYPSNARDLSNMIQKFLNDAEVEPVGGKIVSLISPHAGYEFSGSVAAYGYKAIEGKPFKTVIVVAPSHQVNFRGASVWQKGSFRTPLGDIPLDEKLIDQITNASDIFKFIPAVYSEEHSLEVQLPFLQKVLGNFNLVPIIMGPNVSLDTCESIAKILSHYTKGRDDVLIVASTDMSHYHPYKTACEMDSKTLSYIENFNTDGLYEEASKREIELCGLSPVVIAMLYAKEMGANNVGVLKYANSGDTQPFVITRGVVGYMSAVIYKDIEEEVEEVVEEIQEEELPMLNPVQRKRLLNIARQAMETYIKENKRLVVKEDDPVLNKHMGAFVTLHKKGQLRGCIGNIIGTQPLYLTIRDMAISSSTQDPRFPPVTADELDDIDIEISVLSEPEKITDPNVIEMGKHGVIVRSGFRSGVYLPQVATETGWDRETFMSSLCSSKAGLSPDAWKKKGVDIFIFTAEVFSE